MHGYYNARLLHTFESLDVGFVVERERFDLGEALSTRFTCKIRRVLSATCESFKKGLPTKDSVTAKGVVRSFITMHVQRNEAEGGGADTTSRGTGRHQPSSNPNPNYYQTQPRFRKTLEYPGYIFTHCTHVLPYSL